MLIEIGSHRNWAAEYEHWSNHPLGWVLAVGECPVGHQLVTVAIRWQRNCSWLCFGELIRFWLDICTTKIFNFAGFLVQNNSCVCRDYGHQKKSDFLKIVNSSIAIDWDPEKVILVGLGTGSFRLRNTSVLERYNKLQCDKTLKKHAQVHGWEERNLLFLSSRKVIRSSRSDPVKEPNREHVYVC